MEEVYVKVEDIVYGKLYVSKVIFKLFLTSKFSFVLI